MNKNELNLKVALTQKLEKQGIVLVDIKLVGYPHSSNQKMLSDSTVERIARGLKRYILNSPYKLQAVDGFASVSILDCASQLN